MGVSEGCSRRHRGLPTGIALGALLLPFLVGSTAGAQGTAPQDLASKCRAVANRTGPTIGTIESAQIGPARYEARQPFSSQPIDLPAHCEIFGTFPKAGGTHGQTYAIRYHLRLPENWNGRFLFQGGGGTNGVVGDAMGWTGIGNRPAIVDGYAVVSQDSGHDNAINRDAAWGGETVFGTDAVARRNYGHASLPKVAGAAKELIHQFYGAMARYSYFFGCSKGGQEGMAFAQRYPDTFDGIVAGAPGFSLPKAAVAQTWDVQTFARLWDPAQGQLKPTSFSSLFSAQDFVLVHQAVGRACDALDGLADGLVGNFAQCTGARVLPELRRLECGQVGTSSNSCIAANKITALSRSLSGPRDKSGQPLYATWPWDLGIGSPGWSFWKLGSSEMPSLNILTGGASLPSVFMVPARPVNAAAKDLLDFQLAFRFPEDARSIFARTGEFPHSAWEDIGMRSPDLSRFSSHGGKLIVPHGVSDPVFSINDTIAWWNEVNTRTHGQASRFARVFPVPGMTHCGGGPATDRFDAMSALVAWVEHGQAPASLPAHASPESPWPSRSRPLCAYPAVARYKGHGSIELAENFTCVKS